MPTSSFRPSLAARSLLAWGTGALLLLLPGPVRAEDDAVDRLSRLVGGALSNAPSLAWALAELEADAADAAATGAPGSPSVRAEVRDDHWPYAPLDGSVGARVEVPFQVPWRWGATRDLVDQSRTWQEEAARAAVMSFSRDLVVAWVEWACAHEKSRDAALWVARADQVMVTETRRLDAGAVAPVEAAWLQVARADTATRHHEAALDAAEREGDLSRLAGGGGPGVRDGDLEGLLASTASPTSDLATLKDRLARSAPYRAAMAEADRMEAEGRARTADASGDPELQLSLRQGLDTPFEWDFLATFGLQVPVAVGRGAARGREEGRAMERAGGQAREAARVDLEGRLGAAVEREAAARKWLEELQPALAVLEAAQVSLATQLEHNDIEGSKFIRDMDRALQVRLAAHDAACALLLARLDLAYLLEDPSLFRAAFPGT